MRKMRVIPIHRAPWRIGALAVVLAVLLVFPGAVSAQLILPPPPGLGGGSGGSQTITGAATALAATVLGTTTTVASTGPLADDGDARSAAAMTGSVPYASAEVPTASTVSSINGWDPSDAVMSMASLGDLVVSGGTVQITAGFVMAEAMALVDGTRFGTSAVEGLTVNGVSIVPSGAENQTISLPGLTLVLNEVQRSGGSITVNALRITSLDGLVNLVFASATAGIGQ